MVFGELYRNGAEWKFRAVGQGYASGLRGHRPGLRRQRRLNRSARSGSPRRAGDRTSGQVRRSADAIRDIVGPQHYCPTRSRGGRDLARRAGPSAGIEEDDHERQPHQGRQCLADQGGPGPDRGVGRPGLGRRAPPPAPTSTSTPARSVLGADGKVLVDEHFVFFNNLTSPRRLGRAHRRQPHRRGRGRRRGRSTSTSPRCPRRSTRSCSRSRSTTPTTAASPSARCATPSSASSTRPDGDRARPLRPVRGRLDRDRDGLRRAVPQRRRVEVPRHRPGLRLRAARASPGTSASTSTDLRRGSSRPDPCSACDVAAAARCPTTSRNAT